MYCFTSLNVIKSGKNQWIVKPIGEKKSFKEHFHGIRKIADAIYKRDWLLDLTVKLSFTAVGKLVLRLLTRCSVKNTVISEVWPHV